MMQPVQFISKFHRYSGLLLILLVGSKILSGFMMTGKIGSSAENGYLLHFANWVDIPLIFFFILHSFYGLVKIFIKPQKRNHKGVFIFVNIVALIIFLVAILFIYFI